MASHVHDIDSLRLRLNLVIQEKMLAGECRLEFRYLLKLRPPYGGIRGIRLHETPFVQIQIEARIVLKLSEKLFVISEENGSAGPCDDGELDKKAGELHG